MAENQNNDDKNKKDDDFDPYSFFKFGGPVDNKDNDNKPKDKKPKKFPFFGILLIVLLAFAVIDVFMLSRSDDLTDYSKFCQLIENGEIQYLEIGENYIVGYQHKPAVSGKRDFMDPTGKNQGVKNKRYKTAAVLTSNFLDSISEKVTAGQLEYKFVIKQNGLLGQILLNLIIPIFFIVLLYFFLFRKMGSGGSGGMGSIFNAGASRAKVVEEGKIKTRFTDVAGVDEAKEELVEVVDFLKEPKKYTDIGGKIPKGVLLVGPPGTGKTLLARAVAGEAGVPFFSISGSDFVEMFVGVGASRVRDLFKQAREKAPCIVFIDEIDALGKSRVNGFGGGNDEREQTLNQLLVEMDGFENEKGLIILAATNRADILDPALLRPGRFDRQVPVEKPDVKGREDILRIHSKNVKLDSDVDFDSLAHGTTGFAGADLANVVNEAALLAVRNGRKKVTMEDMNDAIDKVSIGLKKKSRKDNTKEMRLVSVHETGHALIGAYTPDYPPVNKITVVPRSHGVGGFTQYREQEENNFKTYKDMIGDIDVCLGGRAAEEIILGDVSTGASNDIARATDIVKRMIVDFGMSSKFKNMTLGKGVLGNYGGEPNLIREFSEDTQKYIDEEIARIMNERYEHVLSVLNEHKSLLEYIAEQLVKVETMEGKDFYEIVKAEGHCAELEQNAVEAEKSAENVEKTENAESAVEEPKAESEEKPKRKRRAKKADVK
ncbi:MAG: ATP-dependent zinc metalloprotease FtsH [Treponema sp.]|nr:ATP-dependent zinc metalloprotease FtsH [Treponema sp.]